VTLKLHHIKRRTGKLTFDEFPTNVIMEGKNSKEDVYEFKSSKDTTPIRGNSTSPDVDKTASNPPNPNPVGEQTATEQESVTLGKNIYHLQSTY